MGDVEREFKKAANVVKKAVDDTVDSIARSDIGKVTGAVTSPFRAGLDATEDVAKGDLRGAANRLVGAGMKFANPTSQLVESSSSVRDLMRSDTAANLTLGWSRDSVNATERAHQIQSGSNATGADVIDFTKYSAKSAALGASAGYAYSAGLGGKTAAWAAENPAQALITGKLLSEGKYGDALSPFADGVVPGLSNLLTPPPSSGGTRAPAASGGSSLFESFAPAGLGMDGKTMAALAVLFVLIIALIKKRFK